MVKKENLVWLLPVMALTVLVLVYFFSGESSWETYLSKRANSVPTLTPTSVPSKGPVKTPTQTVFEMPLLQRLTGSAYCELKGAIEFVSATSYKNNDAVFSYRGVDHAGRNIYWKISPVDDLAVGPNLFSGLSLPDGQSLLTVSLPGNPKYKKYELTATIDYGLLVDGNLKVTNIPCVGKTVVSLPQ